MDGLWVAGQHKGQRRERVKEERLPVGTAECLSSLESWVLTEGFSSMHFLLHAFSLSGLLQLFSGISLHTQNRGCIKAVNYT